MRIILQRVTKASVVVDQKTVSTIEKGLLLLVGLSNQDNESKLVLMARKISTLRVFPEADKEFHLSVLDIAGSILAVSQFTLYGETAKGRRPDFTMAMKSTEAGVLFEKFIEALSATGVKSVQQGVFGADMKVALENDGPVTLLLEN